MELLLETPTDNPNFYNDGLKAAVLAATISPLSLKNTVGSSVFRKDSFQEG